MLHLGTARSALFNYLYAKKYGGLFHIRIEDTDRARSTLEFEQDILASLAWLGLSADSTVRQSDQLSVHIEAIERLITTDKAYLSKEPAKDNPKQEVEVVRLRNPGTQVTFHDEVRGSISFHTKELGDFVIARRRDEPLYNLAVVVDDASMGITHVIRGEDHISNTPRQILIQEALGYDRPTYAHLPLILAPDRSKMSKRKGAVSVDAYRREGYLPEALNNYLALLGWNPGTNQEVFTMAELIQVFSLDNIHKGGAVFDIEKLKWLNKTHRSNLPAQEQENLFLQALDEHSELRDILVRCPLALEDILERYSTSGDFLKAVEEGVFTFYTKVPTILAENLVFKKDIAPDLLPQRLHKVCDLLDPIQEDHFTALKVKDAVWEYANQEGRGVVLWPLRYALTGLDRSPDPFLVAEALGKKETLARINTAINVLI
jgi:glutamyl-tRNA synthetase